MADGSSFGFDFKSVPKNVTVGGRSLRTRAAACVLDFVSSYGPSGASFIADFYKFERQHISGVCSDLVQRGMLVRWFFDGTAIYALPKDAPSPEVLAAPRQPGRGRRAPRNPDKLKEWSRVSDDPRPQVQVHLPEPPRRGG